MASHVDRWPITADTYERMVDAGILTKGERVELVDGEIVQMAPSVPATPPA